MIPHSLRALRFDVSLLVLVGCAWLTPSALANVHVVAPSGGDFTQIHTAVAAASDGDTLLVQSGSYLPFTVDDKSLWILAHEGAVVTVTDTVEIANLASGKTIFLYGLSINGVGSGQPALRLASNVGHVRAQKCTFKGATYPGSAMGLGGAGAEITSSFSVAFEQCAFTGGRGHNDCPDEQFCSATYPSGGHGVSTALSVTGFYDCTLTGGLGSTNNWQDYAGDGGHGCHVASFGFFASGSSFTGGNGGFATAWPAQNRGGAGGHGVHVAAGAVQLLDNAYAGGAGGPSKWPSGQGLPGSGTFGPGITNFHPGVARLNSASTHAVSGQSLSLTLSGAPGDRVYFLSAPTTIFQLVLSQLGIKFLPHPILSLKTPIAIIPASGTVVAQIPMPTLLPSEPLRKLFAQCVFRSAQGQTILGSPLHIAVQP